MKILNKIALLAMFTSLFLSGCGPDDAGKDEAKLILASSAEWTQRADGLPNFQAT